MKMNSRFLTGAVSVMVVLFAACNNSTTLFKKISPDDSGIHFNNAIIENDSINPLDLTNIYNGGGVAVADFNNDGLQDIYFTGNIVENKLYLNKGDLEFEDVTKQAGVTGEGNWSRGVTVVDINNDGLQDLYVCATIKKEANRRKNLLYVNKGIDKNGIPGFTNMAAEYGLDDTTHSTMAAFFDYDNDGDLDMYLCVNEIRPDDNPSVFRPKFTDGSHYSTGRLYRNDWNAGLKHGVYTNVSKQAGITIEGYGHAVSVADFNRDGWKDIFVTNDFLSDDLLYINNHDGTFTDKAAEYFKHTSANGMGQDVIDINNDGLSDVLELDMNPEDNYRKKMIMGANSYLLYQNSDYYKYTYQYVRNSLQLNQGPRVTANDSIGSPVFSDVSYFAGIAETDWSWSVLAQDFDNDGYRDVLITNGYPKDVTDRDFISFRSESSSIATKDYMLSLIPQVKLHNYAFRNNGNLTFSNATVDWGLNTPSFSNGAAYADLDNDGDLDYIINNINEEAFCYENTTIGKKEDSSTNYLRVHLKGDTLNRNGIGTWIELYYQGKTQAYEQSTVRGYLSSVQQDPFFGLGKTAVLDSVCIKWPNGKKQVLKQVKANQTINVDNKDATETYDWNGPAIATNTLFNDITRAAGVDYIQQEHDFIDFNIQRLIPHKLSEYGPALAVGDLDGNGLDDIICGGAATLETQLFFQQPNGQFKIKPLYTPTAANPKTWEDLGIVAFDAEMDGDLDIYIASGSYESRPRGEMYADKFYVNDGKGNFRIDTTAIPKNLASKSCVRAADYDKDGDLDLFIAGRVEPGQYPLPVSSFIYRNDSEKGKPKFTDVTAAVAKVLENIGLVSDAVWTDFNNDGSLDLILAGEWMPVTFLQNKNGSFVNVTEQSGISNQLGWWSSILPGDFDNDGDIDYVVGNLGLNSFYKASDKYPIHMYAKDIDNNGSFDAIPTVFIPTSMTDTARKEYIAYTRDDLVKQLVSTRAKYPNYKLYANATFDKMFSKDELKDALVVKVNNLSHNFLRNDGGGKFTMVPLPVQTQFSCLNGMVAEDFNRDGKLDVLINGNDYGTEVSVGRYDGCNGLLLQGDGKGGFTPQTILQSGIFIPGNGKALVKLRSAAGKCLLAASQNRGPLKIFECKQPVNYIQLNPLEMRVVIKYKNGSVQAKEVYYGSSFLSQSDRLVLIDSTVSNVIITDSKGANRIINL